MVSNLEWDSLEVNDRQRQILDVVFNAPAMNRSEVVYWYRMRNPWHQFSDSAGRAAVKRLELRGFIKDVSETYHRQSKMIITDRGIKALQGRVEHGR